MNYGPIGVPTKASGTAFTSYSSGILECDYVTTYDHLVTLVGWDDNQGDDGVWIIKNSWGTDWGEGGFVRVTMDQDYNCYFGRIVEAMYTDFPKKYLNYTLELSKNTGDGWNSNRVTLIQEDS